MNEVALKQLARAVIETEARAVQELLPRIDDQFVAACRVLLGTRGRVVVLGVGKSGHIGNKIAATLASTGTPAFFVHAAEAAHGDLGMITGEDVVLVLSNSGETDEVKQLLPVLKRMDVDVIAMTGNPDSYLAEFADINLNTSVSEEACPLGLAPTSSTTAALVMGDALAVALLESRGFTKEDFALSHPAGQLGRRLVIRIRDLMHSGDAMPVVRADATLTDAIVEISEKRLGMTAAVNEAGQVVGVFTDGDLRRALGRGLDPHVTRVESVMSGNPAAIEPDTLAVEAVQAMQDRKVQGLLVLDDDGTLVGVLNFQDLLHSGVV
ncbi:MAG: KpsF/GutQ family sugar-phosphate isomerase [Xanthomonadales bacterium]|jgi:arabinose-5-phosphate isomerase|nr:KpsF/GutQ family sugar-phosphate isomerase [Xanthomonadales bacterium]